MRYKVTALKNVEILAYIGPDRQQQKEWIYLKEGEVKQTGLISGVLSMYAPREQAMMMEGRPAVPLGVYEAGKVYFGLLTIEDTGR